MATITAAMVKDLRETTGVGMMDCKQALTENAGDMQAAIAWLRAGSGAASSFSASGRLRAEVMMLVAIMPGQSTVAPILALAAFRS